MKYELTLKFLVEAEGKDGVIEAVASVLAGKDFPNVINSECSIRLLPAIVGSDYLDEEWEMEHHDIR